MTQRHNHARGSLGGAKALVAALATAAVLTTPATIQAQGLLGKVVKRAVRAAARSDDQTAAMQQEQGQQPPGTVTSTAAATRGGRGGGGGAVRVNPPRAEVWSYSRRRPQQRENSTQNEVPSRLAFPKVLR